MHAMTEAGAEDDRNIWSQMPQGLGEPFPRHMRHGLIGNHQIKALRCRTEHFQSLGTTGAGHNLVAETPQYGLTKMHQGYLVINEEHTLCTSRDISKERPLQCGLGLAEVSAAGKVDRKRRPLAYDTGDQYSTPMVRDDAVHEGQPHAGPLSGPLGGEKGLKNAFHDFGCHTMARIGHGDADIGSGLQLGLLRRHLLVYFHSL